MQIFPSIIVPVRIFSCLGDPVNDVPRLFIYFPSVVCITFSTHF